VDHQLSRRRPAQFRFGAADRREADGGVCSLDDDVAARVRAECRARMIERQSRYDAIAELLGDDDDD
jgi:hypothetical protein